VAKEVLLTDDVSNWTLM